MQPPSISVVITVYNREHFIENCLNSVLNQSIDGYEIIVIDDGSTDKTNKILSQYTNPKIKIILNECNKGLLFSRNRGVREAKGRIIAFTDSDCVVNRDWIEKLIIPFDTTEKIMIVGGKVISPATLNYWEFVNKGNDYIALKSGYVRAIVGCNMAFRKNFLMIHPFDENALYSAADEIDLCMKCIKDGYKIYYTKDASVTHYHRASFRTTMAQQFSYGLGNAYVRIKNSAFPYLSYGSWVLIALFLSLILNVLGLPFWVTDGLAFLYLILVCLTLLLLKGRSALDMVYVFPGFLICCIYNSAGNICCFLSLIRKPQGLMHGK